MLFKQLFSSVAPVKYPFVPGQDPTIKKGSAIIIRPDPAPKLNKTPDPQPFANCMPIPNINEPIKSDIEIGAKDPFASIPQSSEGIKTAAHNAAKLKCATKAAEFPFSRKFRQPEAKPY